MKLPTLSILFSLATLFLLPENLPAAESYQFFNKAGAKLPNSSRSVFYISGTVFNDRNGNKKFDPSDKAGIASGLTLYHLVNGEWQEVNAKPQQTSNTGAYTFAVFKRGSYRIGVKYGNNPNGAYSRIRGFRVGVALSGSRRVLDIPYVTPATAASYGMSTTRNPHRPPAPATPFRP